MPNAWVEFVRQYAKENNLSYGCAISEASPAYRALKKGSYPKTEKKERGAMMGEDFDAPNIPRKKKISIAKKKKLSLPPLQSEREISLLNSRKDDLSKILKAQNVKGISKMKKDDMI